MVCGWSQSSILRLYSPKCAQRRLICREAYCIKKSRRHAAQWDSSALSSASGGTGSHRIVSYQTRADTQTGVSSNVSNTSSIRHPISPPQPELGASSYTICSTPIRYRFHYLKSGHEQVQHGPLKSVTDFPSHSTVDHAVPSSGSCTLINVRMLERLCKPENTHWENTDDQFGFNQFYRTHKTPSGPTKTSPAFSHPIPHNAHTALADTTAARLSALM